MATYCKETLTVLVLLAVQIMLAMFTLVASWTQPSPARPYKLGDELTVRFKNLLPDQTGVVMNGVYVPHGTVPTVPVISRTKLTMTIQLVVTGKPLNQAFHAVYSVPIATKLVNAPRILFVLELKSCKSCGTNCEGCQTGQLCLKPPSLLSYFGFKECPVKEAPIGSRTTEVPVVPPMLVSPVTVLPPEASLPACEAHCNQA